jgi:hypothetical protein
MNSTTNRFLFVLLSFCISTLSTKAEDWLTTTGKQYKGVTVVKVEADAVTIIYSDGGARVPLDTLPADLQKKFNYDPVKAKEAAEKHAEEQKQAVAEFNQEEQAKSDARTAMNKAAEDAIVVQQAAKQKNEAKHGVKPSDIEVLCARVYLDQQAQANQTTTAVSTGDQWKPTAVTESGAVAADNNGNEAVAVGVSVTYTPSEDPAIEKRRWQHGIPELWNRGVPLASALLERPCTPAQAQWLHDFLACAKLAGGNSTLYGGLLQSLTVRPPAPPWVISN